MSAIQPFVDTVRRRADEIAMREMGFERCECGDWTDHRANDDAYCCESCCAEGAREIESDERCNDNRRF